MRLRPWLLKWLMNLYPPLLINRIRGQRISEDFRELDVVPGRSPFNRNPEGTMFGGSMFSAAHPYCSIVYQAIFAALRLRCTA